MAPKVKGVIFDMDGLMFDTERIWDQFWSPCCRKMNLPDPPPEFYSNGRGLAGEHQLQYIAGYYGDKAEELLHAVWAYGGEQIKKGVPCKPGLKELLSYLEDLGMPRIVASSSPRTMVELNLQTTGTARYFHDIVCGNEVKLCKPAPDIFLEAARRIKVDIHDCMVLEDSHNGIRAGHASGAETVMVPDLLPVTDEMRSLYVFRLPCSKFPLTFLAVPAGKDRRIECPCQSFDGFIGVRGNICGLFLFVQTHTPLDFC